MKPRSSPVSADVRSGRPATLTVIELPFSSVTFAGLPNGPALGVAGSSAMTIGTDS